MQWLKNSLNTKTPMIECRCLTCCLGNFSVRFDINLWKALPLVDKILSFMWTSVCTIVLYYRHTELIFCTLRSVTPRHPKKWVITSAARTPTNEDQADIAAVIDYHFGTLSSKRQAGRFAKTSTADCNHSSFAIKIHVCLLAASHSGAASRIASVDDVPSLSQPCFR